MPAFPFIPRIPFYRPYYKNYYSPKVTQVDRNEIPFISTNKDETLSNGGHKSRLYNYENTSKDTTVISKQNMKECSTRGFLNDDAIFDLFGIKLHFDDILLICLIFFLYNEGVKDEMLFISLILLLLS